MLVHIDDPACQLNDLLFLDPKWLFHLLADVVTRRYSKNTNAILKREELEEALIHDGNGETRLPSELIPQMIR